MEGKRDDFRPDVTRKKINWGGKRGSILPRGRKKAFKIRGISRHHRIGAEKSANVKL